jgi:hypothetical protein
MSARLKEEGFALSAVMTEANEHKFNLAWLCDGLTLPPRRRIAPEFFAGVGQQQSGKEMSPASGFTA